MWTDSLLHYILAEKLSCKSNSTKMLSSWVEVPWKPSSNYLYITRFLLLSIVILAFVVISSYIKVLILRRQLPPGPFPLPILGNHCGITRWRPWTQFEKWSQQYNNPMITIWLGNRPVVILNDALTASELLENRADIYSSRPRMVSMAELDGADITNQAVMPYGDRWRLHRKLTVSMTPGGTSKVGRSASEDVLLILHICSTTLSEAMSSVITALSKAMSRKS